MEHRVQNQFEARFLRDRPSCDELMASLFELSSRRVDECTLHVEVCLLFPFSLALGVPFLPLVDLA